MLGVSALALTVAAAGVVVRADLGTKDPSPGIANLQETGNAFAYVTKQVSPAVVFV